MNFQKEIQAIKSGLIQKAEPPISEKKMMEITGKNREQLRYLRRKYPQIFVTRETGRDIHYNYNEYLKLFKSPLA